MRYLPTESKQKKNDIFIPALRRHKIYLQQIIYTLNNSYTICVVSKNFLSTEVITHIHVTENDDNTCKYRDLFLLSS